MKRKILLIVCALLSVAAFFSMLAFERMAGRYYAEGVVQVTPRIADVRYHIRYAQVEGLATHFPEHTIVGVARNRQGLTSGFRNAVAWVYHASPGYFTLRRAEFTEGTAPREQGDIVINEALAWALFGITADVTGLSLNLGHNAYAVSGVVDMGSEPAAWRIIENEPVSTLYIRAAEHDPLAAATVRRIVEMHLFRNAADYQIVELDRTTQSMGIRARMLAMLILIGGALFSLVYGWRAFRDKRYAATATLFIILCSASVVLAFTINHILLWLPNPEAIGAGIFSYIFNPGGPAQLAWLSVWTNVSFAAGVVFILSFVRKTEFFSSG